MANLGSIKVLVHVEHLHFSVPLSSVGVCVCLKTVEGVNNGPPEEKGEGGSIHTHEFSLQHCVKIASFGL